MNAKHMIFIKCLFVMLMCLSGCGSNPKSAPVDSESSVSPKPTLDAVSMPSGIDESKLSNEDAIEGYIVKKENSRILVVGRHSTDDSVNGGMNDSYSAIWFSDVTANVEIGQQVKIWIKYGELMDSYPQQGEAEHLVVKSGLKPEGARMSEAEAILQALTSLTDGSWEIPIIKDVHYDAADSIWKIFIGQNGDNRGSEIQVSDEKDSKEIPAIRNCPDAIIDWADVLQWGGVQYSRNDDADLSKLKHGNKLGSTVYMMSDHACSDYKTKDGDATLLPTGTELYEVEGYDPTYRLIAAGKLYEVSENPKAKFISDLYDIEGRLEKVSFESTQDGSLLHDFSDVAAQSFIKQFLALEYVGFEKVYSSGDQLSDKNKVFIRITLKDGTHFRISYWLDQNALTPGAFGTKELHSIVTGQL
ncbi:YobA family protein [Paenibacillus sp. 2TAB23]|uniref:YobA family protein n=1 Tax=Paenibacillus sp. 2TAB23 TaxID=3233004 RepID=UPI003F9D15C0